MLGIYCQALDMRITRGLLAQALKLADIILCVSILHSVEHKLTAGFHCLHICHNVQAMLVLSQKVIIMIGRCRCRCMCFPPPACCMLMM